MGVVVCAIERERGRENRKGRETAVCYMPGEQGGDVIPRNVQGAKGRCTSRGQL